MENYYKIIRRTAAHGLAEAEASSEGFYKWLALWALDVVCEAVEMTSEPEYSDERVTELGDVLWAIAASAMLLDITEERLLAQTSPDEIACSDVNLIALAAAYSDQAKKVARDQRTNLTLLKALLGNLFAYVRDNYECELGLIAVGAKLRARYPNGYNATDSINRAV